MSFDAGSDFDGLVAGESETLKFIYRVQDPGGTASAVATVTVSVPGEDTGSGSGGGGSTGPWWLAGLALLALLRRKRAASAD